MKFSYSYPCKVSRSDSQIIEPVTKIGGNPIFVNNVDWPKCNCCNNDMDFIGQISLNHPVNFPTKFDMAYLFICKGQTDEDGMLVCDTWEPFSGANAVILQKHIEVINNYKENTIPDYKIDTSESCKEPIIDTADFDIDEDLRDQVYDNTKVWGVPMWLQNNEHPKCKCCGREMIFIAQINAELDGPLPSNPDSWDNYFSLPFGGGDGMGYIFICANDCGTGALTWQCT